MQKIKSLHNLRSKDQGLYGSKATSLGELLHLKMNVPPGFVIASSIKNIDNHQAEIFNAFDKLNTDFVAVRSSANIEDGNLNSFAGQFETYLFVKKDNLLTKIKKCQAHLRSSKVRAYCKIKKINRKKIKLAVIVQVMIQPKTSGVCFTMNPVTNDKNEIIIESCLGLGEALVSGQITPDRYFIKNNKIQKSINKQTQQLIYNPKTKKASYKIINNKIQNQPKMDDLQIKKLGKVAKNIQKHYKKAMDIEWAIKNKKLYILQARPITTIAPSKQKKTFNLDPAKYDHLWDWGAPYLIAAIDQETYSLYGTYDLVSHGVNNLTSLYISKKDKKMLSEKGFSTYYNDLSNYEKKTRKQMKLMEKFLIKNKDKNLNKLTKKQLATDFKKYILQVYKLFENFNLTECIYTEKVEQVLINNHKKYNINRLKENIQMMGEFKLEQRELLNIVWDYNKGILANYLKTISKKLKLDFKPVNYHYKELISLLNGKKITIPNREIWLRGKFSSWRDVLAEDAKPLINSLSYFDKNAKTINGTASNQGKHTGKVRKIAFDIETDYEKEISKMKKGEVLVSGSTGPEMILACQKAGAIVTEEGGVISHAAIISRELNIPCVTGTHIACKVLNTGDLVEVDAFNGIVKILKKA